MNSINKGRMALFHHPKTGEVLLCDFRGYERPEMVKYRPVVVITERLRGRSIDLVTVVPLSSRANALPRPYQIPIHLNRPLSPAYSLLHIWAKCDMLAVVTKARLDRFKFPPSDDGKTRWASGHLSATQVEAIHMPRL